MAWFGQAFKHETDHCEADEGCDGCGMAFKVSHQTSVSTDPGEGPLDDPSFWQHDEAVEIGTFDDLDLPATGGRYDRGHFRSLISSIGEDPFNKRKPPSGLAQQITRAVAILDIGWKNTHAEQKAEGVDEDVTLAARNLLARIEALRVQRRAPF
jgi:hypothetical protein